MSPNGARLCAVLALIPALLAAAFIGRLPPPSSFAQAFPYSNPAVRDASFWATACHGVQCGLCPFQCFLPEGARGRCRVRVNQGGKLKTLVYGGAVSAHLDPIEKKPVFHMLPGSWIYSIAAAGCNLSCKACQNWEISQIYPEQASAKTIVPAAIELVRLPDGRTAGKIVNTEVSNLPPEKVVEYALKTQSKSIAYTYSEPAVFYEYMRDTAILAKQKGLRNVMVSGGYINPIPMRELAPYMDVVKIDLKGFDDAFYRKYVGGRLEPVKRTLVELKEDEVLTEIVNLMIPGLNDSPESVKALSRWIMETLGPDTPLFFSRFSPNYKLTNIKRTPLETLNAARETAMKEGLHYVYIGNAHGPGENTYCPECGRALVKRYGYSVVENLLSKTGGKCPYDGTKIPGIW